MNGPIATHALLKKKSVQCSGLWFIITRGWHPHTLVNAFPTGANWSLDRLTTS